MVWYKIVTGIKDYFKNLCQLNIFAFIMLAGLSFMLSYTTINPIVESWMNRRIPPCIFTVEVLEDVNPNAVANHEVWITELSLGENEDMQVLFENCESNGFEFRSAEEYGYSNDIITNTAHEGSTITLTWLKGDSVVCEFWKQNLSGIVKISVVRGDRVISEEVIDLYTDQPNVYETFTTEIPEYEFSIKYSIFRWGIIAIGTVIMFLLFTIPLVILFSRMSKKKDTIKKS